MILGFKTLQDRYRERRFNSLVERIDGSIYGTANEREQIVLSVKNALGKMARNNPDYANWFLKQLKKRYTDVYPIQNIRSFT